MESSRAWMIVSVAIPLAFRDMQVPFRACPGRLATAFADRGRAGVSDESRTPHAGKSTRKPMIGA